MEASSLATRLKRIHFSASDDMHLLREVVGQNPFESESRWNIIQVNLMQITGKWILPRTRRDRVKNLLKKFLEKDLNSQFKSGIEEEVTELDDLLRNAADLMMEFQNRSKPKTASKSAAKSAYQMGVEARAEAFNIIQEQEYLDVSFNNEIGADIQIESYEKELQEPENNRQESNKEEGENANSSVAKRILAPKKRRQAGASLKQTSLSFLATKNERWFEIRKRELDLEERKFMLEEFEKKKKLELEEQKLVIELNVFKNQQRLMELAFIKK